MVTSRCGPGTEGRPEDHEHDHVKHGDEPRHPAVRRLYERLVLRGPGTRELRHDVPSRIRITLVRGPKGLEHTSSSRSKLGPRFPPNPGPPLKFKVDPQQLVYALPGAGFEPALPSCHGRQWPPTALHDKASSTPRRA